MTDKSLDRTRLLQNSLGQSSCCLPSSTGPAMPSCGISLRVKPRATPARGRSTAGTQPLGRGDAASRMRATCSCRLISPVIRSASWSRRSVRSSSGSAAYPATSFSTLRRRSVITPARAVAGGVMEAAIPLFYAPLLRMLLPTASATVNIWRRSRRARGSGGIALLPSWLATRVAATGRRAGTSVG